MAARILLLACALLCLARGAASADVTSSWIGPQGEWTDGGLWSSNPAFPENGTLTYAAIIGGDAPAGISVQLSRDLGVEALLLRNANLSIAGTLRLTDGLSLGDFGRVSGGTLIASGASSFAGTGMRLRSAFLNEGSAVWTSGDLDFGFANGRIENAPSGSFTIDGTGNRAVTASFPGDITNAGRFVHTSTGTTSLGEATFLNGGLVEVQAGTLRVQGGETNAGMFEVSNGATLGLSGTLASGGSVAGAGVLDLNGASVAGVFDTGTVRLRGFSTVLSTGNAAQRLEIGGAPFSNVRLDGTIQVAEGASLLGGTLSGSGGFDLGGPLTVDTSAGPELRLDGMQITASNGLDWRAGTSGLVNGASITSGPSSHFSIDTTHGAIIVAGAPQDASIRNQGSLSKSGAERATFQIGFENSGSMTVDEGTLALNGAFSNAGQVVISAGTVLELGQNSRLLAGSSLSGEGLLSIRGGRHDVSGDFTPGSVDLWGSSDVHFLEAFPVYDGAFSLRESATATFEAAPVELTNITHLGGTLNVRSGSRLGGSFDWQVGLLASDGIVELVGEARLSQLTASGADLRVLGSATFLEGLFALENGAQFTNTASGHTSIRSQTVNFFASAGSVYRNQGTLVRESRGALGSASTTFNAPFVNAGVFEIQGDGIANDAFKATVTFGDFRQTAGTLWLNGGDVHTWTGAPLAIDAGSVIGNGNLNVFIDNQGRIAPGNPGEAGRLNIIGLTQLGDAAELAFDLGGTADGEFDLIDVREIVLDGELSVRFIDGFQDEVDADDVFEVIVAHEEIQGVLDDVVSGARLATADGFGSFAVFYGAGSPFGATSLVLANFERVPEPAVLALLLVAALAFAWRQRAPERCART